MCLLDQAVIFTKNSVRADLFTEDRNDNFIAQELSKKVSGYINLSSSDWALSTRIVTKDSKGAFKFDEDEFCNATVKIGVSMPSSKTPDCYILIFAIIIMVLISLLLICFMW